MATTFDVRCAQTLGHPSIEKGRCQLLVGHEPPHAVLFSCGGHRVVRTWIGRDTANVQDDRVAIAGLPWMRGLPMPAWSTDPSPASEIDDQLVDQGSAPA